MSIPTISADPYEDLAERIREREALVAIVGLGYVGLPLLVSVARAGYRVVGYDTDPARIGSLRSGASYIVDVSDSDLADLDHDGFRTEPDILHGADVLVVCVSTPLRDHAPDLSMVCAATRDVATHLKPGRLVVLESTTYPGTTEEVVCPILERSGLRAGIDFALAYSPERIDPGQRNFCLENTPKVVAGLTDRCRDVASSFYGSFVREVVTTATLREAEMAKLLENTFRQVNIALMNELAILAKELGVDIWGALEAANTKPFGFLSFNPGPGVGGHCIAIDPTYLSWRAGQRLGYRIGFIEHANEVNNRMPEYVVARLTETLNDAGKPIRGSRILAIGASYKAGVGDTRDSPAIEVMERLARKGAILSYHDPFVPEVEIEKRILRSVSLNEEFVATHDITVVLTAHPSVDIGMLVRTAPMLFDTRGVTARVRPTNVTCL